MTCCLNAKLQACASLFDESDLVRFKAYVENLLQENILTLEHLKIVHENLQKGIQLNPISEEETSGQPLLTLHRTGLQNFLRAGALESREVADWLQNKISSLDLIQEKRQETSIETFVPLNRAYFQTIKPGFFYALHRQHRNFNKFDRFAVTRPFEILTMPIGKDRWKYFTGKSSQPDEDWQRPPESSRRYVSWWSAIHYANLMSIQKGFPPTYDFSDMQFAGKLEDGNLKVKSGDLKINASDGNIYNALGYRLPTVAEMRLIKFRDVYRIGADKWISAEEFEHIRRRLMKYSS